MDKLSKSREEICKDCMFGIVLDNCSSCLYNVLNHKWKQQDVRDAEKK
jgi:hypothetical protein